MKLKMKPVKGKRKEIQESGINNAICLWIEINHKVFHLYKDYRK